MTVSYHNPTEAQSNALPGAQQTLPAGVAVAAPRAERAREYGHRWYVSNADRLREVRRLRYAANPEPENEYTRAWRAANPEKVRAYYRKYHAELRARVFDLLGHKCAKCGASDERTLQIDHINGDGAAEREAGYRSRRLYHHILAIGDEAREIYQILCAKCNREKYLTEEKPRREATAAALAGVGVLSQPCQQGEVEEHGVANWTRATPGGGRNSKENSNSSRLPRTRRALDVSGSCVGVARVAVGAVEALS